MKLAFPEHPETVIVKNEFYPEGLTQKDVYGYYNSNKRLILEQVRNREVMLFINTDINKSIVRRRASSGVGLIKLNDGNFDKLITGRTVSIHSTMNKQEDFGIIDIDFHLFEAAKEATAKVFDHLQKTTSASIRYTGKDSFHVVCRFKKKQHINDIKIYLKHMLDVFKPLFNVGSKRSIQKPNLDLSPNKHRGGYITLQALSVLGLKCMEVTRNDLMKFKKEIAKI